MTSQIDAPVRPVPVEAHPSTGSGRTGSYCYPRHKRRFFVLQQTTAPPIIPANFNVAEFL